MRESEFKAWLEAQGYDTGTVRAQLARVARLERAYGDLLERPPADIQAQLRRLIMGASATLSPRELV